MTKLAAVTCVLIIALTAFLMLSAPHASATWASGAYTTAFVVLLGSTTAWLVCEGDARRYWQGFAVVGGTYFVLIWFYFDSWWVTGYLSDDLSRGSRPALPTTQALAWIYDHCGGEELWTGGGTRAYAWFMIGANREAIPRHMDISWLDAFIGGGQAVIATLLGLLGGFAAIWFGRMSSQKQSATSAN